MAMGTVNAWDVPHFISYVSIVPMFHCNGWCHPWMLPLVGAKAVFTRDPVPERIFRAIEAENATHMGAAPIILQMLAESPNGPKAPFDPPIRVLTAGAPPPPAILEKTGAMGLDVMQVYGLTETFGHISQCLWQEDWESLTASEQAELQAQQGVAFPMVEDVAVFDRATGQPVPMDGQTQGEIAIRGNTVMKGYYKDDAASAEAFADGWFWSGDAAVVHDNGYVQIRDRLKDVIISGGENISSVEVEAVLYRHPDCRRRRSSPSRTRNGARCPAPMSNCARARRRMRTASSASAGPISPDSKHRNPWSSSNCRKPRQARSKSSNSASRRASRVDHQWPSSLLRGACAARPFPMASRRRA